MRWAGGHCGCAGGGVVSRAEGPQGVQHVSLLSLEDWLGLPLTLLRQG